MLDGFTAFERLGRWKRPSLAHRVFGAEAVDDAVRQICAVLAAWGLPPRRRRLTSTICQILLLNRSPLLADLSGEAMAAICDAPAM